MYHFDGVGEKISLLALIITSCVQTVGMIKIRFHAPNVVYNNSEAHSSHHVTIFQNNNDPLTSMSVDNTSTMASAMIKTCQTSHLTIKHLSKEFENFLLHDASKM
jgi:hypothetical protein